MDLRTLTACAVVTLAACSRPERSPAFPPSVRSDGNVFAGGVAPPSGELRNPFAGQHDAVTEGERIFRAMNCDGCHGAGALGWEGPSLVDGRWRYGGADGEVYLSIHYGRPRGMPAYGGILSPDAIWRIVTYLRAQPVPADVPTESWR